MLHLERRLSESISFFDRKSGALLGVVTLTGTKRGAAKLGCDFCQDVIISRTELVKESNETEHN